MQPPRILWPATLLAVTLVGGPVLAMGGDAEGTACRDDGERACEVRELTLDLRQRLTVDAGPNGGIDVEAADVGRIEVVARVEAHDGDGRRGRDLLKKVEILTDDGLRVRGPRHGGWSVSFQVRVPAGTDLDLSTRNGGVAVTGVHGDVVARTLNGGIRCRGLAGSLDASTTNGGIRVDLSAADDDVHLKTTNGAIHLNLPAGQGADLDLHTTNGGIDVDMPVTVEGRLHGGRVRGVIHGGGPKVQAKTTNGGISVREG